MVGLCFGKELDPFWWPMPAAVIVVFGASHRFAEHISHLWLFLRDSESCSGSDGQQTASDHELFLVQVWLWEVLWNFFPVQLLSCSSLVVKWNPLFIACYNLIEKWFIVTAKNKRRHFKTTVLKIFSQLIRHALIELFHLSNLLQMPSDGRMVDVEFFGNLCSCKRISFGNGSQLAVVNFWGLAAILLIFKALISFAKLLELSLHCMFVSSSWAKGIVDVASCLCCFMTHYELELENCSNLLFV